MFADTRLLFGITYPNPRSKKCRIELPLPMVLILSSSKPHVMETPFRMPAI